MIPSAAAATMAAAAVGPCQQLWRSRNLASTVLYGSLSLRSGDSVCRDDEFPGLGGVRLSSTKKIQQQENTCVDPMWSCCSGKANWTVGVGHSPCLFLTSVEEKMNFHFYDVNERYGLSKHIHFTSFVRVNLTILLNVVKTSQWPLDENFVGSDVASDAIHHSLDSPPTWATP
jgi:hypothetical protein